MTETTEAWPRTLRRLFAQGEWWKDRAGEWHRIAEMEPRYRANVARLIVRHAAGYEQAVAFGELALFHDAPEDVVDWWMNEVDDRARDPQAWITGTALYRALTAGLAVDMRTDDVQAARADRGFVETDLGALRERVAERLAEAPSVPGPDDDPDDPDLDRADSCAACGGYHGSRPGECEYDS